MKCKVVFAYKKVKALFPVINQIPSIICLTNFIIDNLP